MCTGGIFSIESWRVNPRGDLVLRLGEWHDVNISRREGLKDSDENATDAFFVAKGRDGPVGVLMGDPTGEEPNV